MTELSILNYCQKAATDTRLVCYPDVSRAELVQTALALSATLQQQKIKKAALWLDDTALFACALLACSDAQIDLYLPPDFTKDNQDWVADNSDILLHNQPLSYQGKTLHIATLQQLKTMAVPAASSTATAAPSKIFLKTSGSNGQPKIIVKTLAQLQLEVDALRPLFAALPAGLHAIGSISPQHMYGLTFRVALSLAMGWIIHPQQSVYPEALFEQTAQAYPCIWFSSPALLHRICHNTSLPQYRQRIAAIVSSGGALSEQVAQLLRQEQQIPLCEIYGSTETGVIAARQQAGLWRWLPGVSYGEDASSQALWVDSPWSDGRQQTADLIRQQQLGFELLGRNDRIIKLEDKRISLHAIEHQLLTHPWVKDAHCAKHPQQTHLAIWVALNQLGIQVWRNQGRKQVIQLLKQHLAVVLEKTALPRYWRFASRLPRNAQSKITQQDFMAVLCQPLEMMDWTKIESKDNGEEIFTAVVPLDLRYFSGHFSEFHLVPGVVEVKWVFAVAQQFGLIRQTSFSGIENLKFQHFLRPNDRVNLALRFDQTKHKLYFKFSEADKVFASGRVVMRLD